MFPKQSADNVTRSYVSTLLHRMFVAVLISQPSKHSASLTILLSCNSLTNKETSIVLFFVLKHAEGDRAQKKCRGKHEKWSNVLPHFLSALPLPKCFITEQSTVKASSFAL